MDKIVPVLSAHCVDWIRPTVEIFPEGPGRMVRPTPRAGDVSVDIVVGHVTGFQRLTWES